MLRTKTLLALIFILSSGCCRTPEQPGTTPERAHEPSIDEEVARLFTHPFPEGELPSRFQFSPDGAHLIYVRNQVQGDAVSRQLWIMDLETRQAEARARREASIRRRSTSGTARSRPRSTPW